MLTLKQRRKRRVPPQRGRGEISGLFLCFAQCSMLAMVVSRNWVVFECFSKAASQSFRGSACPLPRKREWLDLRTNLEEDFEVMEAHLCQTGGKPSIA